MFSLWQDVRYAARTLGRARGFGAIAVVLAWAWLFPELRRARDFNISPEVATETMA